MRDNHDDELVWQTFQEKAEAVSHLFRRRPHNLIEKLEKLGFTYRVDDSEDAEDIAEERAARPKTTAQTVLVYYLDGADTPTESLLALWREETQRNNTPCSFVEAIFSGRKCPTEKANFVRTGSRPNGS